MGGTEDGLEEEEGQGTQGETERDPLCGSEEDHWRKSKIREGGKDSCDGGDWER